MKARVDRGKVMREAILSWVQRDPGINSSDLARRLGVAWSTIAYHARLLHREGRLTTYRHGRELHLFVPEVPAQQRGWIAKLGSDLAPSLMQALQDQPNTVRDLADSLGLAPRTMRRYLYALHDDGLVETRGGPPRGHRYQAVRPPQPPPELPLHASREPGLPLAPRDDPMIN
jgi:predicted transcriptional regulator